MIEKKTKLRLIKGTQEWKLENHKKRKTTEEHSRDLIDPELTPQSEQGCSLAQIGHTSNTRLRFRALIGQFASRDTATAGLPLAERPASPAVGTRPWHRLMRRLMWNQCIEDQSRFFILTGTRARCHAQDTRPYQLTAWLVLVWGLFNISTRCCAHCLRCHNGFILLILHHHILILRWPE